MFRSAATQRASTRAAQDYETRRRRVQEYRAWYRRALWCRRDWGLRALQLAKQPLCEVHLARGVIVAADTVNHRRRVSDGASEAERWALFVDRANHQSVCAHCHASDIQAEERAALASG